MAALLNSNSRYETNFENKEERKTRYNLLRVVAVGTLLVLIGTTPSFPAEPGGTVKITGKSVAAGVGYSWGSGVLTYKGKGVSV